MASPSSSSSYGYQASPYAHHPPVAGKGLPPPVPAPSFSHHTRPAAPSSSNPHVHGHPPDLTERYKLKAKYHKLQKKYHRALEARKDLTVELSEKEDKVQRLQDEVDLIIDQIFDADYRHLLPKQDDLFSDDNDEDEDDDDAEEAAAAEAGIKAPPLKRERDLDSEEDERRLAMEESLGIDARPRNPPVQRVQDDAGAAPQPKRLKLTFGNGSATLHHQ
ncbi:hypothetical protein JCM5296_006944 [Sporobolomyces johnsonii]